MSKDALKKAIQLAKEAVKDEEEPYKTEAFKIILSELVKGTHLESPPNKMPSPEIVNPSPPTTESNDDKRMELARKCELTTLQLDDIIATKGEAIFLVIPLAGSEADKQVKAAQIILYSQEVLKGQDWMLASFLLECMEQSGISSPDNLSRTLKGQTELFRSQGNKRGTMYKLTGQGRTSAIALMKKLGITGKDE